MEVILKNIGPIDEYIFDSDKDFHFIAGHNNVGKSYAITAVYLILKNIILQQQSARNILFYDFKPSVKKLQTKLKEIESLSDKTYIDLTEIVKETLVTFLQSTFVSDLSDSFKNSFDFENINNKYTKESFSIELKASKFSILLEKDKNSILLKNVCFSQKVIIKKSSRRKNLSADKKTGDFILYYNVEDQDHTVNNFVNVIFNFYTNFVSEVTRRVKGVYFLPASRSGLYQALSAFGQIIAELSQSRSFLKKKIELPSISEPLTDYFLKLSEIKINKKNYEGTAENKIAEQIEKDILQGNVSFDQSTKRIIYSSNRADLKLDLSLTSSMVSELSPIVAYLRYVITEPEDNKKFILSLNRVMAVTSREDSKPIIFIEEPEAHLHPEIQVRLTEILSELSKSGVKIIITTHSNYIFNKINNLVMSGDLRKENMSAYVFKSQISQSTKIVRVPIDEYGMDDINFTSITESLLSEKMNILENL